MIQYYNPNLTFYSLFKALIERDAEKNIIDHFQAYTGKKYVLITGSCRASLYLAYKSLGITNKVVATSPLTCFSAVHPILLTGNKIEFIDVDDNTLNIDIELLDENILNEIDAIQIIHHGGVPVNYLGIKARLENNNVKIIEDCAQAYGARYENKNIGSEADVACYSMSKNLYGLGGGILATDNYEVYVKAKEYLNELPVISMKLLMFRIVRNIFETYKNNIILNKLYRLLMNVRNNSAEFSSLKLDSRFYVKPNEMILKINSVQLEKADQINKRVGNIAVIMLNRMINNNILYNDGFHDDCSFTKLFVYNPNLITIQLLEYLNTKSIEAKHLEQKHNSIYQDRFDRNGYFKDSESIKKCNKYNEIHDSIISLPLHDKLSSSDIDYIITNIEKKSIK